MLKIYKEGFFDNTYNYDALILQKVANCNPYKTAKGLRAGYPTSNRKNIMKLLMENEISFVVINNNVEEEKYSALNNKYNDFVQLFKKREAEAIKTPTPKEVLNSIINKKDPYTDKELTGLDGKTITQLESMLKFLTESSVSNYLNYKTGVWNYNEQQLLLELHKEDLSINEISKQLNRTAADINNMLVKLGAKQKCVVVKPEPTYNNPSNTYNKTKSGYYYRPSVKIGDTVTILNIDTNEEFTKTIIQSIIKYKPLWVFDRGISSNKSKGYEIEEISKADPNKNEISNTGALAKAILGKKENDTFTYTVENKKFRGKILKIKSKNN